MAALLKEYTDADVADGLALLDNWGLKDQPVLYVQLHELELAFADIDGIIRDTRKTNVFAGY